jgi:Helix-turn-helix domain
VLKAVKVRLYPTTEQEIAVFQVVWLCKMVLELCFKCLHSTLRTNWKVVKIKCLQGLSPTIKSRTSLVERRLLFCCFAMCGNQFEQGLC